MLLHFSLLAGFLVPFAGLIAPIVIWQIKKDELPAIDAHGKVVVNWMISAFIYAIACSILAIVIIGGIKANEGKLWRYPLSIRVLK